MRTPGAAVIRRALPWARSAVRAAVRPALTASGYVAALCLLLAVVGLGAHRLAQAFAAQLTPPQASRAAVPVVAAAPVPDTARLDRVASVKREAFVSFTAERVGPRITPTPVFGTSRRNESLFRRYQAERDEDDDEPRSSPLLRTVCVRMCDGYYFPISNATTREGVAKDASTCHSACGGEGRLFVQRSPGGPADTLEDLQGRPYAQLPNAFLYRTQYVADCKCKPNPWEAEAKERHRVYALVDSARKGNVGAQAELKALETSRKLAALNGTPLPGDGPRGPAPVLDGEQPMGLGANPPPRPPPSTKSGGLPDWARRVFNQY